MQEHTGGLLFFGHDHKVRCIGASGMSRQYSGFATAIEPHEITRQVRVY
jgi:hypothetical protein